MSLSFASLNSGSNGNCYYLGNEQDAVLIDAGLSCKETEKRMKVLGLSIRSIKAVFISHEHIDHIKGIEVLAKKYEIPIYITTPTFENSRCPIPKAHVIWMKNDESIDIGNIKITAFSKYHDAADPTSFVVECNKIKVGVFTDIGQVCENVKHHFQQCDAVFLEANYDREMLMNGHYPYSLKTRISGGNGHLSNDEALDLFLNHRTPKLKYLLLSHLSKENNDPDLVKKLFELNTTNTEIIIASRYEPSLIYEVIHPSNKKAKINTNIKQLNLFD
jgi:phosphoribosyl 1,2-cyclic phosphodiesterase